MSYFSTMTVWQVVPAGVVAIVALGCTATQGTNADHVASPHFSGWKDYSVSYCSDISERLPKLAIELKNSDTNKKNYGALATGVAVALGTVFTAVLIPTATSDSGKAQTAIVGASVTGAVALAGLVTTVAVGNGHGDDIAFANAKRDEIQKRIDIYQGFCPAINPPSDQCDRLAIDLARFCDVRGNAASLNLDDDRVYPRPMNSGLPFQPGAGAEARGIPGSASRACDMAKEVHAGPTSSSTDTPENRTLCKAVAERSDQNSPPNQFADSGNGEIYWHGEGYDCHCSAKSTSVTRLDGIAASPDHVR